MSTVAKGFAAIVGMAHEPTPWGGTHYGQSVQKSNILNGQLWQFGNARATNVADNLDILFSGRPKSSSDSIQQRNTDNKPEYIAEVLKSIDGPFGCIVVCSDHEILIATDWLGIGSIFFTSFGGNLYVATHLGILIDLIGCLPEFDNNGVASMLAGTTFVGGMTPYKNVKRLQGGEFIKVNTKKPSTFILNSYVKPENIITDGVRFGSCEDDIFEDILCTSMGAENYSDFTTTLMLSGGKDSTAIAISIKEAGYQNISFSSFGRNASSDLMGARKTARRLGVKHYRIPYSGWNLPDEANFITDLGGGAAGAQTAHNIIGFRRVGRTVEQAIVGFLGDTMTGAHLELSYDTIFFRAKDQWHIPLESVYCDEFNVLRDELEKTRSRIEYLDSHQQKILVDLLVRQSTWIGHTFDLCNWWVDVSYPFYNRALMRFLFSLPCDKLEKQKMYVNWLERKMERWPAGYANIIKECLDNFERSLKLRAAWKLGVYHPDSTVNWEKQIKSSMEWMRDSIGNFGGDKKLFHLASGELEHLLKNGVKGVSPILFAMPLIEQYNKWNR